MCSCLLTLWTEKTHACSGSRCASRTIDALFLFSEVHDETEK